MTAGVLTQAREMLSGAVAGAGVAAVACSPYQPDTVGGYAAWIGTVAVDRRSGASYGLVQLVAEIVTVGPRHDRATVWARLEDDVDAVVDAIEAIPGVQVTGTATGHAQVGDDQLPAVTYTATIPLAITPPTAEGAA